MIRSNLLFKPEFTLKGFKKCEQKIELPSVGVEPTPLKTTSLQV